MRRDRDLDSEPELTHQGTVSLTRRLKEESVRLGFDQIGVTNIRASEHAAFFQQWLDAGYHGDMRYLARTDAVERRLHPERAHPELQSAIVVAMHYDPAADHDAAADASRAVIARYARGRDYHNVVKPGLIALLRWLEHEVGHALPAARASVDTAPVFERELARRAGLGWFGRNTMVLHPARGSYFFLATLLVEIELAFDEPFVRDHCGSCNACVDACPTNALLGRDANGAPVMDARRCISYLTIEHRGPIPRALRPLMGNRVFGCDICQEVCPFPRKFSRPSSEPAFASRGPGEPPSGVEPLPSDGWHPGTRSPSLVELMSMDESGWEAFSRGSPLRRPGRAGFLRNVAVALGNWGSPEAVPVLSAALADTEPLVRGHAVWALAEVGTAEGLAALDRLGSSESDPFVLAELADALGRLRPNVK